MIDKTISVPAKTKQARLSRPKPLLTTELFTDKNIPDFIRIHPFFRTRPLRLKKIFPAIGLSNFQDDTSIDKCLIDVRKENSYAWNLLKAIHILILKATTELDIKANELQFLDDDSPANQTKVNEIFNLVDVLHKVLLQADPTDKNVVAKSIISIEGKITLYLIDNVYDNFDKRIFKAGEALLKVYNALYEKLAKYEVYLTKIDNIREFKTFCAENIPNRKYKTIFSSEGKEGAWDLLTMAMRGIKSCQRWDGDYPHCLIGSILSRFVGIIYLTSGVEAETNPAMGTTVVFNHSIGPKMMRRCIVRYVYDREEEKPFLLLDKMYPEFDRDILEAFISSIRKRCKLEVYYAPDLSTTNRLKNIYTPLEKTRDIANNLINIRADIKDSELSYQDVPIKSKDDLQIHKLHNHREEVERYSKAFEVKLSLYLTDVMEGISSNQVIIDDEIKKSIKNIQSNVSLAGFCDQISRYLLSSYKSPSSSNVHNSKAYYKQYLRQLLISRKNIAIISKRHIATCVHTNASRTCNTDMFQDFVINTTSRFIKNESKKLVSAGE